jgi:hypothetical protein
MLEPYKIAAAMAFDPDYKVVVRSKRDKVRLYGNAVTPPVAEIIISASSKRSPANRSNTPSPPNRNPALPVPAPIDGRAGHTGSTPPRPGGAPTAGPNPSPNVSTARRSFTLADLDAFAASRTSQTPAQPIEGEPDELIGVDEFAALRQVKPHTFKRYVEDSLNAWQGGEDGYLPQPDQIEPLATAPPTAGAAPQPPRGSSPPLAEPAAANRPPPTRRPPPDTPGRRHRPRPSVGEIAAALTERLGTEVSS